jgi:hypothetical protein
VGGRELEWDVATDTDRASEDVDEVIEDCVEFNEELVGDKENDSESLRSHLWEVDGRETGVVIKVDMGAWRGWWA